MTDPHTLYFKLDDDVAFIRPGSFEAMLETFVERYPYGAIVSANLVNALGFTPGHQYIGAVALPYSAFAASEGERGFWTSMAWLQEWLTVHVTFLERLAGGDLGAYDMGTWRFNCDRGGRMYDRFGLNFALVPSMSWDEPARMMALDTFNRDEVFLTKVRPQLRHMDAYVAGAALAVHVASSATRRHIEREFGMQESADHAEEERLPPIIALRWRYAAAVAAARGRPCCAPDCPLLPPVSVGQLLSRSVSELPPELASWNASALWAAELAALRGGSDGEVQNVTAFAEPPEPAAPQPAAAGPAPRVRRQPAAGFGAAAAAAAAFVAFCQLRRR
eukprot:TRINITY_DN31933_c0_g1_i1.p2 TRINITY_DN31933_c0_g1~~TRINITY_DN31933_c0_g1_i1.p2  ORF type:complete len:333 (+),score=95.01 TRINITY_DN31933_c0_g1_i1:792-1790(+)